MEKSSQSPQKSDRLHHNQEEAQKYSLNLYVIPWSRHRFRPRACNLQNAGKAEETVERNRQTILLDFEEIKKRNPVEVQHRSHKQIRVTRKNSDRRRTSRHREPLELFQKCYHTSCREGTACKEAKEKEKLDE